jgi:hypothetical protein
MLGSYFSPLGAIDSDKYLNKSGTRARSTAHRRQLVESVTNLIEWSLDEGDVTRVT